MTAAAAAAAAVPAAAAGPGEMPDPELELTPAEQQALRDTEVILDENSQEFVDQLVGKLMKIADDISGLPLRPYQRPVARRICESVIIGDGARITALACRQSGKSTAIGTVLATCMLMLPRLAKVYPGMRSLQKFRRGVWVGTFGPVDEQAEIIFGKVAEVFATESCKRIMADPEIAETAVIRGRVLTLKNCGSFAKRTTCHPKAAIEGRTYHVIVIDEAQGGDNKTVNKSIIPMGTATRATYIFTGTPWYTTNFFYNQIQKNKRIQVSRGRRRQNHFQWDWKEVARYVPEYKLTVQDAMLSMGENSDEFRMSYKIEFLTAKGMFITEDVLNDMGDTSQQELVRAWTSSPVVAGIDCARIQDRTVVTVLAVDWDHPDTEGFFPMYILNWLDLEGLPWEQQYFRIAEFLGNYHVYRCGVDTGGVGDVVIDRLRNLMPHITFAECRDSSLEQSERWKYLGQVIDRRKLSWPYGAKIRDRRVVRRFMQEMADLRKEFRGPYLKVEAPREADAHDDYPDSLAIAAWMARPEQKQENQVIVTDNVFYGRSRSRGHRGRTRARTRQFQPLR
jgi:hypothetical protein